MTTEVHDETEPTTPDGPSDAELITAVHSGDSDAYATRHDRHHHAAQRLARTLAKDHSEADDLVAESFTRVLAALQAHLADIPPSAGCAHPATAAQAAPTTAAAKPSEPAKPSAPKPSEPARHTWSARQPRPPRRVTAAEPAEPRAAQPIEPARPGRVARLTSGQAGQR